MPLRSARAIPLWLLDPDIPIHLHVERMERAHLEVFVLIHYTSRDLQGRRRFDGRRRRRRISGS